MSSNPNLYEPERTNYVNDFHSREILNLFHYAKLLKAVGCQFIYISVVGYLQSIKPHNFKFRFRVIYSSYSLTYLHSSCTIIILNFI